ncbi:zonadhesin-like isoform X1 [Schistocerca americana]|uniref:zonadhesin-like isoform X1 n=1 Tax=Schistocerca americana TaxID=7009 RepID=UPI001F4F6FEC|nr:zonadhesin-like isoform X1 [Schistocerca americana]
MNYLAITLALLSVAVIPANGVIKDRKRTKPYRCQPLILTNGIARMRNSGQEMRFKCSPGFRLLGDQYATCVRGRWNVELPVCVRRGCDVVPDPTSGSWQLSMGGAVATLVCDPGYTLSSSASSQIYCNGRVWRPRNLSPACRALIHSPKSSCDFESEDICGWSQDSVTDFLWIRNNYSTPSGHLKTGPSFDHTYGSGFGGHYMYIESSSPRKENDFARLYSPVYGKEFADDGCFMFWYNMYGTTIGSLKIYVKPQSRPFKDLTPSFLKYGNQGARWIQGIISLTSINDTFQVIIEATRGNGFLGDIAVDDVALRKGDDCLVVPDQPITAAIRQDVETATREPLVKSFPTFLPAPPLPDLPPMPPAAEATPPPPPPPPSTFPLPATPRPATAAGVTTSTTNFRSTISTTTSASLYSYRPRQTTSVTYPGNRTSTVTPTFNVSKLRTVITERPPIVATTERNVSKLTSSSVGTKYRSVVPVFTKHMGTTRNPSPSANTSASFNRTTRPTTKPTSARVSALTTPTVTTAKSPPTVPITRRTVTSTTITTRRPSTSTSVYVTTSKQPVTKVDYKKKLVTNTTVIPVLPSKVTTPSTTSSTRSKVQRFSIIFKTAPTPTTTSTRFLPTTVVKTTLLPLTTIGSTKPASPSFQRVVKPRWSSNRIQVKAAPPSGPSAKTIGIVVAVILAALLSVVAFFVVKKRLRLRRQRNVAEDSDVRYLTSDEILDFNMARPADDDA